VVEYGRRFLECLSINLTYPYAGIRLKDPDRIVGILSMPAGIPMTTLSPSDSLIILPNSLVDQYSFWQSEIDISLEMRSLTDNAEEELINEKRSSTRLKIALLKETGKNDTAGFCNSGAQV